MCPSSPPTHVTNGYDRAYDEVLNGFELWTEKDGSQVNVEVKHSLYEFLRNHLKSSYPDFGDELTVPKYSTGCDIAIGDEIGIVIIYSLPSKETEWIHQRMRSLFRSYERIIIYGHQIHHRDVDKWRQIKRRMSSYLTYKYARHQHRLEIFETIQIAQYRIPMTDRFIAKYVVYRVIAFSLWVVFAIAGALFLDSAEGSNVMTQAYIVSVIIFNVVILSLLILIIKM